MAKASKAEVSANSTQERIYKGTQELDHDLFKLDVAKMKKLNPNYVPDENDAPRDEDYVALEHCHFFHTVDSSGRKMTESNAVGGHVHLVKVTGAEDGVPTLEISPPMRQVKKKVRGKWKKSFVELEHDTHTHTATYLGSTKIKPRVHNEEFAKLEANMKASQVTRVEGVVGG